MGAWQYNQISSFPTGVKNSSLVIVNDELYSFGDITSPLGSYTIVIS